MHLLIQVSEIGSVTSTLPANDLKHDRDRDNYACEDKVEVPLTSRKQENRPHASLLGDDDGAVFCDDDGMFNLGDKAFFFSCECPAVILLINFFGSS